MRIAVIGLGSMGKRRIRLLRELNAQNVIVGVDGRADRRAEAEKQYQIPCCAGLDALPEEIDCAFVCTSPLSHSMLITDCLSRGWHVFTELNLVTDGYGENLRLAREKNRVLFLSSTFLYREETRFIRSRITRDRKWNYVYHIGQYLPDWHPWERYQDYFVGYCRTNGCREILAIELPWLTAAFGEIEEAHALSDRMSGLSIGYDDNYLIQFRHKNGNKGSLIVDVVSPCAVRKLEAYAEGAYLSWEGTPESLMEYDNAEGSLKHSALVEETVHQEGYRSFVVENAYRNEIQAFFDAVSGKSCPEYGFAEDQMILKIIDSLGA